MDAAYEDEALMKAIDTVLVQYEVTVAEAERLRILKNYDIIVIADDSGSMRMKDEGMTRTRWDELEESLKLIVSLGSCFDEDGLDIYFINRDKVENVKSTDDERFQACFQKLPMGRTDLSRKLEEIVKDREGKAEEDPSLKEKPVLLMIFTDGRPDDGPEAFGENLRKVLQGERTKLEFRCQLFACTGKDEDIAWAKELDDKLEELDMTDDYLTEKKKMDATGAFSTFTMGDWCLKAMLGAVDPTWDDPCNHATASTDKIAKETNAAPSPYFKLFLLLAILGGVYYVVGTFATVSQFTNEL